MGTVWVILSSFGFATLGIFGKFAYQQGFSREVMLLLRFATALPCMVVLLLATRVRLGSRRKFGSAVLLGAVGIGVEATLFFLTLERLGAALTGIFLYLYPAFVALFSHFFLRERLTKREAGILGLAFFGTCLTAGIRGGASEGMVAPLSDPLGLLYGVLTGAWYAVYILVGNRLTRDEEPLWMSTGVVAGAGVVFGILALASGFEGRAAFGPMDGASARAILGLGILATVLPFVALYLGLKKVGAMRASLISTLEMVFTIVLARVFLGEALTPEQWCGASLVLISVLLVARRG